MPAVPVAGAGAVRTVFGRMLANCEGPKGQQVAALVCDLAVRCCGKVLDVHDTDKACALSSRADCMTGNELDAVSRYGRAVYVVGREAGLAVRRCENNDWTCTRERQRTVGWRRTEATPVATDVYPFTAGSLFEFFPFHFSESSSRKIE